MAKPKKSDTDPNTSETPVPKRTIIRAKSPMEWGKLLKKADETHWRKLRVTIQVNDMLLAGKPANLDAAQAMLKARGLEDFMATSETVTDPVEKAAMAEKVSVNEGLCEFSRREGKPGIWMPSNNIKAGLKENWSVLGLRMKVRGSRGALAEGLFVAGVDDPSPEGRDWIYLGEKPDGVHTAVAHTVGASGPVSSIKRHEFVMRPKITFEVWIASVDNIQEKISDDELASTILHMSVHGVGACRSQGFGKFTPVSVEEVPNVDDDADQHDRPAIRAVAGS